MSNVNISPAGLIPGPVNLVSTRVAGYDLARAIAFLGMVFVNFRYLMNTDDYGSLWLLWLADRLDGRPAVTFVILAGIGISLLRNSRLKANSLHQSAWLYLTIFKRAAFFFLIGLLFSCVWHADILHFYGIYFAVAVLLVNASDRTIFILTGAVLVGSIFLAMLFNFLTLPTVDSVWDPAYWTKEGILVDLFVNGCYPVFPWIVYFLLGIWLGRQNLSDTKVQKKIFLIAAQTIVICEIVAFLLDFLFNFSDSIFTTSPMLIFFYHALDTSPFSLSILSVFSASGTALVIIILSMKLAKKAGYSKWLKPFHATAQMSLTLYIVHIGIIQLFLLISGRGAMETSLEEAWIWAIFFCLILIIFATYWVNHFGRGPMEKILRWVSK
jgi:uncharacterized membrane protein YeiB